MNYFPKLGSFLIIFWIIGMTLSGLKILKKIPSCIKVNWLKGAGIPAFLLWGFARL